MSYTPGQINEELGMSKQRQSTILDWLMENPHMWFTREEIDEKFPMWPCAGTLANKMTNIFGSTDLNLPLRKKELAGKSFTTIHGCNWIDVYSVDAEYLKFRVTYDNAGMVAKKFMRLCHSHLFPYW